MYEIVYHSLSFSYLDEDVDEEHEYQRASIVVDIGGLEVILKRFVCVL